MNTSNFVTLLMFLLGVVLCAAQNTIQLQVHQSSTKSWLALYPVFGKWATTTIEVREASSLLWVPAVLNAGNGYFQATPLNGKAFNMPLSFRLTGANGDRVVASNVMVSIQPGATVNTSVQFTPTTTSNTATPAPTLAPTQVPTQASAQDSAQVSGTKAPVATTPAPPAPPAQATTKPVGPTVGPTAKPATQGPTIAATRGPTVAPTQAATRGPTIAPTLAPTTKPATPGATVGPTRSPTQGPTPTATPLCSVTSPLVEPIKILVPLYVYPGEAWDQLLAVAATGVKIIAVINPNNGPLATGPDAGYTTYMQKFQAANIDMIGYVHTLWGARNMSIIKSEIDLWATKYTGVKGIFFDEGSIQASDLPYYTTAYNYVQSKAGFIHTVLNPGQEPDQGYLAVSTSIVIFENYANTLINTNFDSFVTCAPNAASKSGYKYKFTAVIHTAALSDMPWLVNEAHSKGMGMVYVTDGLGGCCTYNTLTTYFPQEGADVQSVNT